MRLDGENQAVHNESKLSVTFDYTSMVRLKLVWITDPLVFVRHSF